MFKRGFSLFELVIVMVIAGIIYSTMVYSGGKQKDLAIYRAYLNYLNNLNSIGCEKYIQDNNISYFNNSNLNIPPVELIKVLDIKENSMDWGKNFINNGLSPNNLPVTFTYNNMTCTAKTTIPKDMFEEGTLKFKLKKELNGNNYDIYIYSKIDFLPSTKTQQFYTSINTFGGAFEESVNNGSMGSGTQLLDIYNNSGNNLNVKELDQARNNLNTETYQSLSYESFGDKYYTDGRIPPNMGYIK